MDLGSFSLSLAVADLAASQSFYEKLGFRSFDGDGATWVMLQQGTAKIGLFHGLFEGNAMTFNPSDVRGVQRRLKADGISLLLEADEQGDGPAHAMLTDPDGNVILLDQLAPTGATAST